MAIGVNWAEIWKPVWADVWDQVGGGGETPIGINWAPIWKPVWGPVWATDETDPPGDFDLAAPAVVPLSGSLDVSGSFSFAGPTEPTITIRLVDAAASGSALPSLTGIQWAWWDSATDLSDTLGVSPTNSGTAESTDGSGNLVVSASSSTKTSGQQAFVMLHVTGSNPRTFGALLTVD